jgi:hypothetical protein
MDRSNGSDAALKNCMSVVRQVCLLLIGCEQPRNSTSFNLRTEDDAQQKMEESVAGDAIRARDGGEDEEDHLPPYGKFIYHFLHCLRDHLVVPKPHARALKAKNAEIETGGYILAERGGFEPPIEVLAPITV